MTYSDWITAYVARTPRVYGMCASATLEMVAAFPELRRVAGHADTVFACDVAHWWCVAPDGSIVDPTVAQFDGLTPQYREWQPGDEVRVGRCMNCGDDIYRPVQSLQGDRIYMCGPECESSFIRWQGAPS